VIPTNPSLLRKAVVSLLLLCACAHSSAGDDLLLDASARASKGHGNARVRALAGFSAYLIDSKPQDAAALWKSALEKEEDVWALFGIAESDRRSLDMRGRARAALRICALEPAHPLCAVGARIAWGSLGQSPALDREIEQGALDALGHHAAGDAAFLLRNVVAAARRNRGDEEGARAAFAEAGMLDRALLLGPWSPHHFLEWSKAFAPELGTLEGDGPLGRILPREAAAPDGHFVLWSEPTPADIYYWVSDVVVPEDAIYQARVTGSSTFALFVDGAPAFERRDFEAWLPESAVVNVRLAAGRHRLAIKLARGTERGDVWAALSRADGRPANLACAPAQGAFERSSAPAFSIPQNAWPTAAALAAALQPDVGSLLAGFAAARDSLGRDGQGARTIAERLLAAHPSASLLTLHAESLLADHSLPQRASTGRAHHDLEQALALDPTEASALLRLVTYARGEGRLDEAATLSERLRAAASPSGWQAAIADMQLAQARGVDALAQEAAGRALAVEPGQCDALEQLYDLARKNEAIAEADRRLELLSECPDELPRKAAHLRSRGDLQGALEVFERMAAIAPLLPGPHADAAQLTMALGKSAEAAARWADLAKAWPYAGAFQKKRADALEASGDLEGARAARQLALQLDGSDLKLRRALAAEKGAEPLDDMAEDGRAWIERYKAAAPPENAPGVYVLDASAIEAAADGSFIERTHAVAKVVDQRGVSMLAEVPLPEGAEVLSVRTLKQDGRILEPEQLGGKDGISLPGVEVGDFVEWEYLVAHGSRGPALPGFAAPKFYFRIADGQLFHSVYEVRAPAGSGLAVDPHGLQAPAPETQGGVERVRIEREQVPTFVQEPNGTIAEEVIPFVQIGAGADNAQMFTAVSDFLLDRSRPNAEVMAFARQATAGLTGRAAVAALYAQVMKQIKGPEAPLTTPATATLVEGRGSRLMLMRSALRVLGIDSRIVLVRPFGVDPASYRFPSAELFGHAVLRVRTPEGELFLEPGIRFAPFGRLAPQVSGQLAAVLPEPGEKAAFIQTPASDGAEGKRVSLALALDADGTLSGTGEEVYEGFSATQVKSALERIDDARRRQAVEAAITRSFVNATLQDLSIEEQDEPGSPVAMRYRFTAPGFARRDGDRLVIPHGLYPMDVARRFLALSKRETPLLIGNPEQVQLSARLALPAGMRLEAPPQSAKLDSPFGRFEHTERIEQGSVLLEEKLALPMARVPPDQYQAFGEMLVAIDRAQGQEWVLVPATQTAPAPSIPAGNQEQGSQAETAATP
jgi:hypothetical protein